ncbi:hypothetical protein DXG01_013702 [Tephrocybe rancida]|nr:hypothetical protein DXG01_013702 [Tephrocybe rancida]
MSDDEVRSLLIPEEHKSSIHGRSRRLVERYISNEKIIAACLRFSAGCGALDLGLQQINDLNAMVQRKPDLATQNSRNIEIQTLRHTPLPVFERQEANDLSREELGRAEVEQLQNLVLVMQREIEVRDDERAALVAQIDPPPYEIQVDGDSSAGRLV